MGTLWLLCYYCGQMTFKIFRIFSYGVIAAIKLGQNEYFLGNTSSSFPPHMLVTWNCDRSSAIDGLRLSTLDSSYNSLRKSSNCWYLVPNSRGISSRTMNPVTFLVAFQLHGFEVPKLYKYQVDLHIWKCLMC